MSENREFHGSSVDAAVEQAMKLLDRNRDEIEYEIADSGSVGFLGIGSRDARIIVSNASVSHNWVDSSDVVEETFNSPPPEPTEDLKITEEPEVPGSQESLVDEAQDNSDEPAEPEVVSEEALAAIREHTVGILDAMGLDARVDIYDAGDFVAVDVATSEAGLFIGQKGETIDALQHLLNVIAYKNQPFGKRIVLDSEGYRQRRIEAIEGMAHRSARRAIREQRTVELPPMNASERRIVHVYLKENIQVDTNSAGDGGERRVVISPQS